MESHDWTVTAAGCAGLPGAGRRDPGAAAGKVGQEKYAFVLQIVDNPLNNTVIMLAGLVPTTP